MAPRILVLVRHADASHGALRDELRELTPTGRSRARALGGLLATRIGRADLALVSPALRARHTLEEMSALLPVGETLVERDLYLSDAETILERADAEEGGVLLLVGHEPTISEAAWLLGTDPEREGVGRGISTATAVLARLSEGAAALPGAGAALEVLVAPRPR